MKQNNDLFSLVNKLNKTEKTYFKKFAVRHFDKNNSLVNLFDKIEKQKTDGIYNEDNIKKRLESEKQIKNLPVTKIHLYKNLLKSLNLYYAEENTDIKISLLLNNAVILYNKGLFSQSLKFSSKAKQMAERYSRFAKQLEAIHCERTALRINSSLNEVSNELMSNYDEELKLLDKLQNISEYRKLYDSMVIAATQEGYKPERNRHKFDKILSDKLMKDYSCAKYFYSRVLYYLMHCFINNLNGKFNEAVKYGTSCLELIGSSEQNRSAAAYEYILILQELVLANSLLEKTAEAEKIYLRLKDEQESLLLNSPERIKNFLKARSLTVKLNINFDTGRIYECIDIISELSSITNTITGTAYRDEVIVTDFMAAAVYFTVSEYDKALHHLNRIFNSKLFMLREDIQISCRILNLLVHYEMGNLSSLEYFTRSTYRYLVKLKKLNEFEKLLLDFLRKTYKINDNTEIKRLFTETRKILDITAKEKPGMLQFIDLDAWLLSKIEKKPYIDILKKKLK